MPGELLHFIHTRAFDESADEVPLYDEDLRSLQQALLVDPEAGNTVPGAGGIRKIRVGAKGKGKRGGARVIYYLVVRTRTVYLLLAYDKSEADNLTPAGKRTLKQLAAKLNAE